jgi:hypothetical protein
MLDFKYTQASFFDRRYEKADANLASCDIREVAKVYKKNMRRVWLLYFSGSNAIHWGESWGRCVQKAGQTMLNLAEPTVQQIHNRWDEVCPLAYELFNNEAKQIGGDPEMVKRMGENALGNFTVLTSSVDAQDGSGVGEDTFRAILVSMVLLSWAAFESLAGDLWVAAVDLRPKLADSIINARRDQNGNQQKGADSKKVDFAVLKDFNYNLTGRLGSFLRHVEKVDFDNLEKICHAYDTAFGEEAEAVTTKNPYRSDLRALELVRNVWAHRAGIVDDQMCNSWKGITIDLPNKGSEFIVDGAVARQLIDAAICSADSLIRFVDAWLVNNS